MNVVNMENRNKQACVRRAWVGGWRCGIVNVCCFCQQPIPPWWPHTECWASLFCWYANEESDHSSEAASHIPWSSKILNNFFLPNMIHINVLLVAVLNMYSFRRSMNFIDLNALAIFKHNYKKMCYFMRCFSAYKFPALNSHARYICANIYLSEYLDNINTYQYHDNHKKLSNKSFGCNDGQ